MMALHSKKNYKKGLNFMKLNILDDVEFYASKLDKNRVYAEYSVPSLISGDKAAIKFCDIDSPEFKGYLRLEIIDDNSGRTTAEDIVQSIHDYHLVYGNDDIVNPRVRTAGKLREGLVEYALYDRKNHIVAITPNGYDITTTSEHKFLQKSTNASQVLPKETDKSLLELMHPYVSASKDKFLLVMVWLVQTVCEGNHSMLVIIAKAGSGKSTLTKIIRNILDPSSLGAGKLTSRGDSLITTLTNSYVVTLDNLTGLKKDESDTLAVAITGGTYSKRQAYTTNNIAVYDLHNTIIANGLDILPEESDLAERCLCLELESIEEKRISDSEIAKNFERDLPFILDAIFNTISKAMNLVKNISPRRKPRMLDSYEEMLAIALALGISEEKFESIYFKNIDYINKMRANNDLVYAVREYMTRHNNGKRSLEGTANEVYTKIYKSYSGSKASLPGSASQFTRKVKGEYASLLAAGFIVNVDDTHEDGTHVKIIKNKN